MKLKLPEGHPEWVIIGRFCFFPDNNGVVDIPDEHMHDGLYAAGFTVAVEQPEPEPQKTAVKPAVKETSNQE